MYLVFTCSNLSPSINITCPPFWKKHSEVCVAKTKTKQAVCYVTSINSQPEARQVRLQIESLRRFGGELGQFSVCLFSIDLKCDGDFSGLGDIIRFPLDIEPAFQSYQLRSNLQRCQRTLLMIASSLAACNSNYYADDNEDGKDKKEFRSFLFIMVSPEIIAERRLARKIWLRIYFCRLVM